MASHLKNYITTLLISLLLLFLLSFILTIYIHNDELDLTKTYKTPLFISRNIVFITMGLMIGYKEHQRGVFHGIICSLVFIIFATIISFLSIDKFQIEWIEYLINLLIAAFGGIIGVNMPKNLKSQH